MLERVFLWLQGWQAVIGFLCALCKI